MMVVFLAREVNRFDTMAQLSLAGSMDMSVA
jgi:hypothetical protein